MKLEVISKIKNAKNEKTFFAIFGKRTGHIGLKICTGFFFTRIYNFVLIKIFVGGRLKKMKSFL